MTELGVVIEPRTGVGVDVLKGFEITGTRKVVGGAKRGNTMSLLLDGAATFEHAMDAFGLLIAERPRWEG